MTGSIFEQEIQRLAKSLGAKVKTHDRGVLIGFIFSLLPVFPVVFLGLGLGIFHMVMHRAGRISNYDYGLVRRGLYLATFNCLLSLVLVWGVVHMVAGVQWEQVGSLLANQVRFILSTFFGRVLPVLNPSGVTV